MFRFPPISVEILVQLFVVDPIVVDVVPIDVTTSASLVAFLLLLSFLLLFLIVLRLFFVAPRRAFRGIIIIRVLFIATSTFLSFRSLLFRRWWRQRSSRRPRRMIVFHLRPARIVVLVVVLFLASILLSVALLPIFLFLPIVAHFLFLALFFIRTLFRGRIALVSALHPALIKRLNPSNNRRHVPAAAVRFQHLIIIRFARVLFSSSSSLFFGLFFLLFLLRFHSFFHRYPGLFLDQFFVVDDVVRRVFHVQLAFSVEKREKKFQKSQFQLCKGKVAFAQYNKSFETINFLVRTEPHHNTWLPPESSPNVISQIGFLRSRSN